MTMNVATAGKLASEINITPMIDVLLVLLIIFMVIVPATSRGEVAQAPKPSPNSPHNPDAVVLEVLKGTGDQATFRINQQTVSRADLARRLAAIYANRAQRVLFVKGDDQLSFMQIAEVIDISHSAGIDHVGLMTSRTATGL